MLNLIYKIGWLMSSAGYIKEEHTHNLLPVQYSRQQFTERSVHVRCFIIFGEIFWNLDTFKIKN